MKGKEEGRRKQLGTFTCIKNRILTRFRIHPRSKKAGERKRAIAARFETSSQLAFGIPRGGGVG